MADDPLEGADQQVALAGKAADYKAQAKTAAILEEALSIIRSVARTNDYFVGYSLAEVIDERLQVIGVVKKDAEENAFVPGTAAERTQISQVNHLWELLLGKDEGSSLDKGGAIGRAINAGDINDLKWDDDEGED